MNLDISQFVGTFLEESAEGLDTMEASLLNFDGSDPEVLHVIFRAAHSIKGGAGTFGLTTISEFTHGVETLLDQMRDGLRPMTDEARSSLLESVDCLRGMLDAAKERSEFDPERVVATAARIQALLEAAGGPAPARADAGAAAAAGIADGWAIHFEPDADILTTGNEPLRMFAALRELGPLQARCHSNGVPPLDVLDPTHCHLRWELELNARVAKEQVEEIFEWVDGQCRLEISPLKPSVEVVAAGNPDASKVNETAPKDAPAAQARESSSIRVSIDKVDALINMVGELVITQSMLSQLGDEIGSTDAVSLEKLREGLTQLERNTRELQESVMGIRMLPISFIFSRFPRLVHDLSHKLGKNVRLEVAGESTELDKTVMEKIGDPLVHLVRNAIDHGIEVPEARRACGKEPTGILQLNAYHKGGNIIIEIRDDGAGIDRDKLLAKAVERGLVEADRDYSDEEVFDLIFAPGLSTAASVSEVSGRGVGMDVVKKNIKSLGGNVEVRSAPGQGTTFSIRLPLTLAILDGQLVRVDGETYIIPLISISESLQIEPARQKTVTDAHTLYRLRNEYIPMIKLRDVFQGEHRGERNDNSLLVVVEADRQKLGLEVDDLLGQQQVVIKSLETNFSRIEGISGATILGDGTVALILDVAGLMSLGANANRNNKPRRREAA